MPTPTPYVYALNMNLFDNKVRKHLLGLQAYSNARKEFAGEASVFLDANELPFEFKDNGYNRYPDPLQQGLKKELSAFYGVTAEQLFLGNGSDEAIDLLMRLFLEPGKDSIMVQEPTYSMYKQAATINNIRTLNCPLNQEFNPNEEALFAALEKDKPKMLFFCSPNNPTGEVVSKELIERLCDNYKGLVVVDEAYVEFCLEESVVSLLNKYANLVILRTLSKAWGMAGLRVGAALAHPDLIDYLNRIKPPYNIPLPSQYKALEKLQKGKGVFSKQVATIIEQRSLLADQLIQLPFVKKVYPSKANFLLVEFTEAKSVYKALAEKGIVVRDRSGYVPNTLRISIGKPQENELLIQALETL